MSKRGRCKHSPKALCFICGEFIKTRARKHSVLASAKMCEAYNSYFSMPVGDQGRIWTPHFASDHCKKLWKVSLVNILLLNLNCCVFSVYDKKPRLNYWQQYFFSKWNRGEKRAMKFAIPRIWREPTNHTNDCYFYVVDPSKRRTGKNAPAIVYPSIPSSIAPVPHSNQLPVPIIPIRCQDPVSADESTTDEDNITIDNYVLNSNSEEKNSCYPN